MSNSETNLLIEKMFKSRTNCLLLNVSSKADCEPRFDFSVLWRILPSFCAWCQNKGMTQIPQNAVVTLCCTNQATEDVKDLGVVNVGIDNFPHQIYLVKSAMLGHLNISLLRTTMERMHVDELNAFAPYFDNIVILDFFPWRTASLCNFYKDLSAPFSIAMMDGFNRNSYAEQVERPAELEEIRRQYVKDDKLCCQRVYKEFNQVDFASLTAPVKLKRLDIEKDIEEKIKNWIDLYFKEGGPGLWESTLDFVGKNEMQTNQIKINLDNVIKYCIVGVLHGFMDEDEYRLFREIVPDWENEARRLLTPHLSKECKMTPAKMDKIYNTVLSKLFPQYILSQLNQYIKCSEISQLE